MALFKPIAEANLRHGIETFLESKGCDFVISEVRSDWGIADYVGVFMDGKKIRGQNHSHVSLDNRYYHQLLARVNGKKSRSSLYAEFGVSPSTLDPYIDTLIKLGYLVETVCGDSAFVEKKRLFVPCTSRMYAVEAKIKDWKKGLFQASRYTIFANRTYLAVPFKIATRAIPANEARLRLTWLDELNIGRAIAHNLDVLPAQLTLRSFRPHAHQINSSLKN